MKKIVVSILVFSLLILGLALYANFKLSYPITGQKAGLPADEVSVLVESDEAEILPQEESVEAHKDAPDVYLPRHPQIVRAVYLTGWSASVDSVIARIIDLARETEVNAVVIDINDSSGYITYDTDLDLANRYGTESVKITNIVSLINRLHEEDIYIIARMTVFQNLALVAARSDLAVRSKSTGAFWVDYGGQAWIDPAAREAWEYSAAVAKDALRLGFDEVNFDYIRFPSDGDLADIIYPAWDEKIPKRQILSNFFSYLRDELPEATLSVDLFGLTTVNYDDLGIGQVIEDAYRYFDVVSPMVYPSHYAFGFRGLQNPAEYPYEVVGISMANALLRLKRYELDLWVRGLSLPRKVSLRPWLQDFNLGAVYDAEAVKAEIGAVEDVMGDDFAGFMLWNPFNVYTTEALRTE